MQGNAKFFMEKNPTFPQLFWGMTILGVGLVISSIIAGYSLSRLRPSDTLTVIGSAKRDIRSDYVVWNSSVSSQQATLPEAYQQLKKYSDRVVAYLKAQGVPDNALTIGPITTETIFETNNGFSTGRVQGYRLSQSFSVSSPEVDRIAQLARTSSELISEGIPFNSEAPQFIYTKLSEKRIEMIKEATEDAKRRAEAIVSVTGNRVGVVRKAETDVFQITRRFSTDVSSGGIYDTTTIDKDITAVVSITFTVQ
jgi:hypothetical protein